MRMSPSRFVPLAFPSSVEMYLEIERGDGGRTQCRWTTYFKSSSNSLQLNRVINDVKAAGMMIIGVLDGRFDESVVDRASLSLAEAIGFGIEMFAMD